MLPQHLDHWLAPFPAKLTAVTNTSGNYFYTWSELITDGSGGYTTAEPGRSGNATVDPARELNNLNFTPSNTVVWMRFRGMSGANTVYEFDGTGAGGGGTVGVGLYNTTNTNTYSVANTSTISFNDSTGFTLSGSVVGMSSAANAVHGIINSGSQYFDGIKYFNATIQIGTDTDSLTDSFSIGATSYAGVPARFYVEVWDGLAYLTSYSNNTQSLTQFFDATTNTLSLYAKDNAGTTINCQYGISVPGTDYTGGTVNTAAMQFVGGLFITGSLMSSAPSATGDPGTAGQIAYDSSYFYVCTALNTWKRAPIATW